MFSIKTNFLIVLMLYFACFSVGFYNNNAEFGGYRYCIRELSASFGGDTVPPIHCVLTAIIYMKLFGEDATDFDHYVTQYYKTFHLYINTEHIRTPFEFCFATSINIMDELCFGRLSMFEEDMGFDDEIPSNPPNNNGVPDDIDDLNRQYQLLALNNQNQTQDTISLDGMDRHSQLGDDTSSLDLNEAIYRDPFSDYPNIYRGDMNSINEDDIIHEEYSESVSGLTGYGTDSESTLGLSAEYSYSHHELEALEENPYPQHVLNIDPRGRLQLEEVKKRIIKNALYYHRIAGRRNSLHNALLPEFQEPTIHLLGSYGQKYLLHIARNITLKEVAGNNLKNPSAFCREIHDRYQR